MHHQAHDGEQDRFIAPHHITARYGVTVGTLRRWAEEGKLDCRRCPGGKRLYRMADVARIFGEKKEAEPEAQKIRTVCYARVSSQKQAADLARQIEALQVAYPDAEVLSDIGSGLNWKRPHFVSLLERAHRGEFSKVVVAHKDRLCRFAFELVEWIFAKAGVEVVVHGDHEPDRNELADDLLSVVNVFVARHNGLREAASRKRRRERAQQEKKEGTTTQKKDKNQHGKRRKRRHTASSEGGDEENEEEREYSDESEEGGDLP